MGYDGENPAYLVYYPEVNKVKKVQCLKFLEQRFYQLEIREREPFMPTPITRKVESRWAGLIWTHWAISNELSILLLFQRISDWFRYEICISPI